MESKRKVKFLLITANIGSLFEEFGNELKTNWIREFHKLILEHSPTFIGLHLQEVGGKTHDVSNKEVQTFFDDICSCEYFENFHLIYGYFDDEHTEQDKYTALGCVYFVHTSISNLFEIWSFSDSTFKDLPRQKSLSSLSKASIYVQKYKFPLSCYSKNVTRWPRKGFTWTRWRVNKKTMNMLNIHLTHDASNIEAALTSPTKYAKQRRRALEYALERLADMPDSNHTILYGDFNVRPDTKELIEHLMDDKASEHREDDINGKTTSLVYRSKNGSTKDLLKVGARYFEFSSYEAFCHERIPELIKFDKELDWVLQDRFKELPITFQPTYPHKEEPGYSGSESFAQVRCPSWCDRVIVDTDLYSNYVEGASTSSYDSYGNDAQVGDHKPVFLLFEYVLD